MRQSKTLDETIYERGSEIDITSVFDSQLSPVGQLMANCFFTFFTIFGLRSSTFSIAVYLV